MLQPSFDERTLAGLTNSVTRFSTKTRGKLHGRRWGVFCAKRRVSGFLRVIYSLEFLEVMSLSWYITMKSHHLGAYGPGTFSMHLFQQIQELGEERFHTLDSSEILRYLLGTWWLNSWPFFPRSLKASLKVTNSLWKGHLSILSIPKRSRLQNC